MGAVTEVAEVHPDTKDLPSENRVWGFRTPARYRIRKSAAQAAESRRENAPIPMKTASGISQFLLTDQVGTLRAVADTSGNIVKRIDYDSFGNIIADTNPAFSVPFGFAGGLHDRDTGLVRFGARDYDPVIGRFTAKDPIDFDGGDTNLYAYSMSDPVNFVDPEGLASGFHTDYGRGGERLIDFKGYRFNQLGQLVKHIGKVIGEPTGRALKVLRELKGIKPDFFLRAPIIIIDPCAIDPSSPFCNNGCPPSL
jgi:RHS repeat-associated protein